MAADETRDAAYECGWCFGTGIHHYNTDDMDRLTMPCPNRDCPKSPDWWHSAAIARRKVGTCGEINDAAFDPWLSA